MKKESPKCRRSNLRPRFAPNSIWPKLNHPAVPTGSALADGDDGDLGSFKITFDDTESFGIEAECCLPSSAQ